jgi:hypothetical protein
MRKRIQTKRRKKVQLLPHHRNREVLETRNTSKVELAARYLFNEPIPA